MAKAAFNKKKILFTSELYFNLRKKLLKCYIWRRACYGAECRCRSEIPGKFWNVVLEKDGDHLDRSCEKKRKVLHRVQERRNVLPTKKEEMLNKLVTSCVRTAF
jgi:hypothetical protein